MNKQLPSSLSRFAGIILLVFCFANLVAQTCTGNLLSNPGFENGLTAWNTTGDVTISTSANSGTKAAKLGGTGYSSVGFILPATAGTAYTAKVWAKETGTAYKVVELRFLNSSWTALPGGVGQDIPSATYTERTMSGIAPTGTAYVYVIGSKDGNGTLEVDDWCLTSGGTANYADLVPSNLSVPTTIAHGSAFTYSFVAKNTGSAASVATTFKLEMFGYVVAYHPLQALQPNQQVTISKTMTLPQGFLFGSGTPIITLDAPNNLVQELTENNNSLVGTATVVQGTGGQNLSDLSPSSLAASPSSAPQNSLVSVNYTRTNLGTAPIFFNAQPHIDYIYLSTDNVFDATDVLLEGGPTPLVTPIGSTTDNAFSFTVPNGTLPGAYFLILKSDDNGQVTELNENNNTTSVPFTVTTGSGPCGVVATLEGIECYDNQTPTDPSDDQYCVTLTATYTGAGCSPYFTYNQENFTYGSGITVCGFPANGTPPSLLLQDSANPSAQTTVTAQPPAGCSNSPTCNIAVSATPSVCFDLGTPTNPADDSFTFTFTANGSTGTWVATFPDANASGTSTVFSGQNGEVKTVGYFIADVNQFLNGATVFKIADSINPSCFTNVSVPAPAPCSNGGGTGQIDLSLALQQLTATPTQWNNYSVKATISNAGPQAATGVKVKFAKPTGVVYVGGNQFTASQGTFNSNGDEVWTVGSIPANGSATLTVNYFLLNATAPVAYAQVTAADQTDSDSQPNNGTPPTPVQDDEASTAGGGGTCPGNLLQNPGFEQGNTIWNLTGNAAITTTGNYAALCVSGQYFGVLIGQNVAMSQTVPAVAGKTYTVSCNTGIWVYSSQPFCMIGLRFKNSSNAVLATVFQNNSSSEWQNSPVINGNLCSNRVITVSGAAPTGTTTVEVFAENTTFSTSGSAGLFMDDFCLTESGGGPAPQPDLTLADLQIPTASVAAGAILNYNFDASNAGTAAVTGNFTIKSYISTDQTLSANDVQDGTIQTGNYAAGFSVQNVAGASTIPANLAAGSYYLLVKIDGDNSVVEGNENNNVVVKPFTVTAGSSFTCPGNLLQNGDFESGVLGAWTDFGFSGTSPANQPALSGNYSFFLSNGFGAGQAGQTINASAGTSYTLTFLAALETAQPQLQNGVVGLKFMNAANVELAIPNVNISGSTPATRTLTATAPAGTAKLQVLLSVGFSTLKVDNFCLTSSGPAPQPDLTLSNLQLSASSTAVGGNFNFTFTESNIGTAASGAFGRKSFISTDNVLSANDLLATSTTSNGLAAGGSNSLTQTVILPATLAAGSYFLIVRIDADGAIAEGNENNNTLVQSFTVTGGTPPSGDCSTITITSGANKITIAGFSAPHVLIKVFRPNWTVAFECLDGACATPTVVTGLGTGSHFVEVKLLNAAWGEICKKTQTVGVTNIQAEQDERLRLSFDRIYPNPTAYLTTLELYSPVEQAATLDFYDRTGRLVQTLDVQLEQGQNLVEQLVFDWKSGTYNVIARGEQTGLPAYGRFLKVWEE